MASLPELVLVDLFNSFALEIFSEANNLALTPTKTKP